MRLLGLLAAHLQVDELNVGGRLVVGRDDGDVLGGVIGPDEGLHRLLDELLLLNITQTSFSSKRLGELGRALDGRDVVNERLGRLAVQLGFLEDDERPSLCSSEPTVIGDVRHVVVVEPERLM